MNGLRLFWKGKERCAHTSRTEKKNKMCNNFHTVGTMWFILTFFFLILKTTHIPLMKNQQAYTRCSDTWGTKKTNKHQKPNQNTHTCRIAWKKLNDPGFFILNRTHFLETKRKTNKPLTQNHPTWIYEFCHNLQRKGYWASVKFLSH